MAEIASSTAAQDRNAFIFLAPFVAVSIRGFRFRSLLCHQHATRWPRKATLCHRQLMQCERFISRNGTFWNVGSDHSGLMLANLITFAHFSTSAVMNV